jgi:hypothetical protein
MSTRSDSMARQFDSSHQTPEAATSTAPPASIETLRRHVEAAEAAVRTLEQENKQLRSDRAKAILAAAKKESCERRGEHDPSIALPPEFHELSRRLQFAEGLLRSAEQERDLAIRAVEETLKAEFSRQIEEIRQTHAAEIAAKSDEVARLAWQELGHQVVALTKKLEMAETALLTLRHEHEAAAHAMGDSLRTEVSQKVEEMRAIHAAELAAQANRAKERFAEELISSLAAANAAWKEKSDDRVRKANRQAADALGRARFVWRSRSRIALFRLARIWRAKEKERLAEAKAQWRIVHRKALAITKRRWQAKLDRSTRAVRRPRRQFFEWQHYKKRLTGLVTVNFGFGFARGAALRPKYKTLSTGYSGCMAGLLILATIVCSPVAPFASPTSIRGSINATVSSDSEAQSASLPLERTEAAGGVVSASDQIQRSPSPKASQGPQVGHVEKKAEKFRRAPDATAQASPTKPAAGSPKNRANTQLTEAEIRARLQQKIRNLRFDDSAQ